MANRAFSVTRVVSAAVERDDCVACFGEEEPAFDEDAQRAEDCDEPRGEIAENDAERPRRDRCREDQYQRDRAQRMRVLAREDESHFVRQVVLFGMRLLETA